MRNDMAEIKQAFKEGFEKFVEVYPVIVPFGWLFERGIHKQVEAKFNWSGIIKLYLEKRYPEMIKQYFDGACNCMLPTYEDFVSFAEMLVIAGDTKDAVQLEKFFVEKYYDTYKTNAFWGTPVNIFTDMYKQNMVYEETRDEIRAAINMSRRLDCYWRKHYTENIDPNSQFEPFALKYSDMDFVE